MKKIIGYIVLALIFPIIFGFIGYKSNDLTVATGLVIGLVVDCVAIMFGFALTMIDSEDRNKTK